jgi:hypothetical protein
MLLIWSVILSSMTRGARVKTEMTAGAELVPHICRS